MLRYVLFIAALLAGSAHAEGLRIEALGGNCQYGKGQDGQWRKDNYATEFHLTTRCGSLGASQALWPTPAGMLGWRAAYVDFGTAKANTFVPARDDEANSFPSGQQCNQQTFSGCVGQYKQWGRARGLTLGALLEGKTGYGTFGIEGGMFRYTSYWRVQGIVPGPGTCSSCSSPETFDWNGAKGVHYTWYVGFTYEFHGLFVQLRRYNSGYASQSSKTNSPLDIGAIAGPMYSAMIGIQLKL